MNVKTSLKTYSAQATFDLATYGLEKTIVLCEELAGCIEQAVNEFAKGNGLTVSRVMFCIQQETNGDME